MNQTLFMYLGNIGEHLGLRKANLLKNPILRVGEKVKGVSMAGHLCPWWLGYFIRQSDSPAYTQSGENSRALRETWDDGDGCRLRDGNVFHRHGQIGRRPGAGNRRRSATENARRNAAVGRRRRELPNALLPIAVKWTA